VSTLLDFVSTKRRMKPAIMLVSAVRIRMYFRGELDGEEKYCMGKNYQKNLRKLVLPFEKKLGIELTLEKGYTVYMTTIA
jgi:hypothetical protein